MTRYARLNLLAMAGLPAAASLAALWVFGPRADTLAAVAGLNLLVMLAAGLFAALLLRAVNAPDRLAAGIALSPAVIPALAGSAWYLWRALRPEEVAPGREYLAGPQYLLLLAFALWILAWAAGRLLRAVRCRGA